MSAEPVPSKHPVPSLASLGKEFWGGVTLVAAWVAVLFVGLFGGDIETADAGGGASSVPVVVVVAIALLATVSVGHWAFRPPPADKELRETVEDQRRELDQIAERLEEPPATARR